jgi:hypothetical protein
MRQSIVLVVLAVALGSLSIGCMPNGEGPLASFAPRGISGPNIKAVQTSSVLPKVNSWQKADPTGGANE